MTFLSPASGDRQFFDEGKHSVLGHMPKLYPESYPSAPQNAVGTTKLWAWGGQLEPRLRSVSEDQKVCRTVRPHMASRRTSGWDTGG